MCCFWLANLFCISALVAAAAAAGETGELIIVTPVDGKSINGELIQADAAKVLLRLTGDTPRKWRCRGIRLNALATV